jgi:hypothetical protein
MLIAHLRNHQYVRIPPEMSTLMGQVVNMTQERMLSSMRAFIWPYTANLQAIQQATNTRSPLTSHTNTHARSLGSDKAATVRVELHHTKPENTTIQARENHHTRPRTTP